MKRPCEDANPTAVYKGNKFNLALCARPKKPTLLVPPKARELQKSANRAPKVQPLPQDLAAKLEGLDLIIGIDIETHDWEVRSNVKGGMGQYGFYTICHPDDFLVRVVQIGWVIGNVSERDPAVKEYTVKPEDFTISDKASKYHKITNQAAHLEGTPLRVILLEFIADIRAAVLKGGRVAAHNLEFVA